MTTRRIIFRPDCSGLRSRARPRPTALRRTLERDNSNKSRKLRAIRSVSAHCYRRKGFGSGGCFGQHRTRRCRKGLDPWCLRKRPTQRKWRVWQMERGFQRNSLQRPLGSVTTITKNICMSRQKRIVARAIGELQPQGGRVTIRKWTRILS